MKAGDQVTLTLRQLVRLYNSGYKAGHHDTVEGGYAGIFDCDMDSYHQDDVEERLREWKEYQ